MPKALPYANPWRFLCFPVFVLVLFAPDLIRRFAEYDSDLTGSGLWLWKRTLRRANRKQWNGG